MLLTLLASFVLQGCGVLARSHLPFLPTPEGIQVNDAVSRSLGLPDSNGVRRPRNVVSVLSLLWPQVVGPIENGIIKEEGYKEIPKTSLEQQLEGIRERSHQQMMMRAHVRDLINHGAAPSQLTLQEMYALNTDMGGYHPHPAHAMFHPLHEHLPPPLHPHEIPFFDSVIIQDSQLPHFPDFQDMLHRDRIPKKLELETTTPPITATTSHPSTKIKDKILNPISGDFNSESEDLQNIFHHLVHGGQQGNSEITNKPGFTDLQGLLHQHGGDASNDDQHSKKKVQPVKEVQQGDQKEHIGLEDHQLSDLVKPIEIPESNQSNKTQHALSDQQAVNHVTVDRTLSESQHLDIKSPQT